MPRPRPTSPEGALGRPCAPIAPPRPRLVYPYIFLILALAAAWPARATERAIEPPACPQGAAPGATLTELMQQAKRNAPNCQDDPAFLAWHGALLLASGRPGAALEVLERALLLAPEHQGARLDYARALAALGQGQAAQELIAEIRARPDLPERPRAELAALVPPPREERLRPQLTLKGGVDSNLNYASAASQITLTLPEGAIALPVERKSRARSGSFLQAELELAGQRAIGAGKRLELYGRLSERLTPAEAGLEQSQLELAALLRQQADDHERIYLAALGATRWDGLVVQRQARLGLRRNWQAMPSDPRCTPGAGLDLEWRAHPGSPSLDYRYLQGAAALSCNGDRPWSAQIALGREFADDRPGQGANRLMLRGLSHVPLAGGARLELEGRLNLRREDAPFSPLLAGGARLATVGYAARIEWARPLTARRELALGLVLERQQANVPLFDLSRHALYVAWQQRW